MRMTENNIMVLPDPDSYKRDSGIIVPDTIIKKNNKGTIIMVGPDIDTLHVGDYVLYSTWMGTMVEYKDQDHVVMKEGDIIAILKKY